jgi:hypothetical protein
MQSAIKGNQIHFPLPIEHTLRSVARSLPSNDRVCIVVDDLPPIQVDSLPTKQRVVWRQVVDFEKVYVALKFLVQNNPQYTDIEIDIKAIAANGNFNEFCGEW